VVVATEGLLEIETGELYHVSINGVRCQRNTN
jgi:hypothetical protein